MASQQPKVAARKQTGAPAFAVGIDLGTTNSALAFRDLQEAGTGPVEIFPIVQITGPGEARAEKLLPSFLYLAGAGEFAVGALALPWDTNQQASDHPFAAGYFALRRGGENAGRLVKSAKSWLSHAGVDRTSALLPFHAPEGVAKISPVEASCRYLEHMREAWDAGHAEGALSDQDVLVTVPASFDEAARELTQQAARDAGLGEVTLLEEPQAAFYAWLERHPDWRERIDVGDLVLVIDIGGGTTDFSLIAVKEDTSRERAGELSLERVAVGEHILLGGDNIDLALAHAVAAELTARGTKLDAFQMQALWNNCRDAKEKLLEETADGNAQEQIPVSVLGKGSGLVGGTIRAALRREQLEQVLEGFLPRVASDEMPQRRRSGLQEIGLPYAADAAVTRHLARFLRGNTDSGEQFHRPTHVLFNGGVLRAPFVRKRLMEVLNSWLQELGSAAAAELTGEDLFHAVARGAAYYGVARRGQGVRIRGGISRSYYVGIESASPAVPGFPAPMKALAVAQFGMEEGTSASMPGQKFGLAVGGTAEFRFFSSATRHEDPPGTILDEITPDMEEMPPMEVALESGAAGVLVPVTLETVVTETGTLQVWCVAQDEGSGNQRRWKLEFNVRERVR